MFRHYNFQRIISSVVLTTFSSLTLYPSAVSAQMCAAPGTANITLLTKSSVSLGGAPTRFPSLASANTTVATKPTSSEERLSQLLKQIQNEVKAVAPATNTTASTPAKTGLLALTSTTSNNTDLVNQHVSTIRTANSQIKALYSDIDQSFKDTEQHLKDAKLSSEILARHSKAVAVYQSRQAEFDKIMDRVAQADDKRQSSDRQAALADLSSFMDKYPNAKPHQYTDPNKLPFGSPSNKVRKPNESKAQYRASLFPPKYEKVMLAGKVPDGLQLAQATLPDIPVAQDTAETEDIQLTPAVKAQAAALNNNPVQIYNWVRNNISFIPSYGSVQGSELTLQNKRGNAFDTASLLIALYRSAGIPARYVYGTIDVPADKVMNWVGGVTRAEAAQSLLGQGGIPNTGLSSAGQIGTIRMEHVWVEAFVDYIPSRGAVNKNPNTWVPIDASFKQYRYSAGMDFKNSVPISTQGLLDQLNQGAIANVTQGYIQKPNQVALQYQLATYQSQIQTFVGSQNASATVDDMVGAQTIIAENFPILLGSLPYKTVVKADTFQILPDNLRWKFKTNIYADDGIAEGSNPFIEINQSTASLAGKKITLAFAPATSADQALISSYLPKAHSDNTPIALSELPTSLPGYLLQMKGELRINGQLVAQTPNSFPLGGSLKQINQYFNPATGNWVPGDAVNITVGEYDAIGIDLQGANLLQLQNQKTRLQQTQDKIVKFRGNQPDPAPIAGLTLDDITGDIVQSGILSYFTKVDANDLLTSRINNDVVSYRLPSYGRFYMEATPRLWFGIVRSVSFSGIGIDIPSLRYQAEAKNGDPILLTKYMRQVGAAGSASEHAAIEQLFRDPNKSIDDISQPQGISAVKILAIAASQGQKIYTLNSGNAASQSVVATLGISADAKMEIANALAIGKEVTVHENAITVNGWSGSGYVIVDPDTGSGAYKLDGGTNGGRVPSCAALAVMVVAAVIIATLLAVVLLPFIIEGMIGVELVGGAAALASASRIAVAAFLASFATLSSAGNSGSAGAGVLCANDDPCVAQWKDDTKWCDNNYSGAKNIACHDWAREELWRCREGQPSEPFRL